jgi:hypothetical protein
MMAHRPSGALSPSLARMRSAYRLCNYLLIGLERKSWAHSQNGARELAGQVGQSLIFSNVSNNDRRFRNPEEHAGSITVPTLASTGD